MIRSTLYISHFESDSTLLHMHLGHKSETRMKMLCKCGFLDIQQMEPYSSLSIMSMKNKIDGCFRINTQHEGHIELCSF